MRGVRLLGRGSAMKKFRDVLGSSRKLLLSAAGLVAVAVPITIGIANTMPGQAQSQTQNTTANAVAFTYDVVSVKPFRPGGGGRGGEIPSPPETPDGFTDGHVTLSELVQLAFGMRPFQVQGVPSWYDSAPYAIDARMDGSKADALKKLSPRDQILARQHMLQALLADRFKMTFHQETKEVPVYFLVIAKNGSLLQEAKPGFVLPHEVPVSAFGRNPDGTAALSDCWNTDDDGKRTLTCVDIPIFRLVGIMTEYTGDDHPVLDKTGLTGKYDFTVRWVRSDDPAPLPTEMSVAELRTERARRRRVGDQPILEAIEKQLGLKLESGRGSVEYVVIDHVEKPSGN
jgi:bla regulator protein blaR1